MNNELCCVQTTFKQHLCYACRPPKLSGLELLLPVDADDSADGEADDAAPDSLYNNLLLLGLARLQLTALRTLNITVKQGWADNSTAWSALGMMTQLTGLAFNCTEHLHTAVTLQHLSAPVSTAASGQLLTVPQNQYRQRNASAAASAAVWLPARADLPDKPEHTCGK
jgi:hypothetical protein